MRRPSLTQKPRILLLTSHHRNGQRHHLKYQLRRPSKLSFPRGSVIAKLKKVVFFTTGYQFSKNRTQQHCATAAIVCQQVAVDKRLPAECAAHPHSLFAVAVYDTVSDGTRSAALSLRGLAFDCV